MAPVRSGGAMTMSDIYDAEHPRPDVPNPGSPEALAAGCRCPSVDNEHGRLVGGAGFYLFRSCPLHGSELEFPTSAWREQEPLTQVLGPPPARVGREPRKALVGQIASFLNPGETPRFAFVAVHGTSPKGTLRVSLSRYGIVVTERAVIVFELRGRNRAERVRRLPRNIRFGPRGHWWNAYREADLAGEPIWLHWEYLKDARQADAELPRRP